MKSNIRNLRKERRIPQSELGKAINVSQQIVSRMERDRNCITVRSLIAIADYFDVSTDEVLGYEPETAKEERIRSEKKLDVEIARHLEKTNSMSVSEQLVVYKFILSMKRCLDECGI